MFSSPNICGGGPKTAMTCVRGATDFDVLPKCGIQSSSLYVSQFESIGENSWVGCFHLLPCICMRFYVIVGPSPKICFLLSFNISERNILVACSESPGDVGRRQAVFKSSTNVHCYCCHNTAKCSGIDENAS